MSLERVKYGSAVAAAKAYALYRDVLQRYPQAIDYARLAEATGTPTVAQGEHAALDVISHKAKLNAAFVEALKPLSTGDAVAWINCRVLGKGKATRAIRQTDKVVEASLYAHDLLHTNNEDH